MSRTPDEEKRKRILEAAVDAFGDIGYKAATIKSIADTAGIAPGSIYTYFTDKDELFLSTINSLWDQFVEEIDKAIAQTEASYEEKFWGLYLKAETMLKRAHSLLLGIFAVPTRRALMDANLQKASSHLWSLFLEGDRAGYRSFGTEPEHGILLVRVLISGLLFNLALVDGAALDQVLAHFRIAVRKEFLTMRRENP